MKFLPILFLILHWSEARVALSEKVIDAVFTSEAKERPPLHYPCTFRSLPGDPYPSVVLKFQNQVQRSTWDAEGKVKFDRNYEYPVQQSHSYPSGAPLSGGSGTTAKPFSDVPIVPEGYIYDDIIQWFTKDCVRPY